MSEKLVVSSADVDLKAQVEKELLDRLGKESIGEPPKLEHSSPDSDHDETRRMELFDTFSDPNNLSLAFSTAHVSVFNKDNAIILDINQFISYYHEITSVSNNIVIITALSSMFDELKRDIKQLTAEKFVSLVVPLYVPFLEEPEISRILTSKICDIVGILDGSQRFEFAFVLQESIQFSSKNATDKSKLFKQVVQIFQKHLSSLVSNNQHEDLEACEDISNVVQALGIFCKSKLIQLPLTIPTPFYHTLNSITKLWKSGWI